MGKWAVHFCIVCICTSLLEWPFVFVCPTEGMMKSGLQRVAGRTSGVTWTQAPQVSPMDAPWERAESSELTKAYGFVQGEFSQFYTSTTAENPCAVCRTTHRGSVDCIPAHVP